METIKTAMFEALLDLVEEKEEGSFIFRLDGQEYQIEDRLQISRIAEKHGYIVIY